jgi:hypothetical protein
MLNIVRVAIVVVVIAAWQRVRMGVPLETLVENPNLLWTSAARLAEMGFRQG